jgi:magnesium-transporting ATPase (P-type)
MIKLKRIDLKKTKNSELIDVCVILQYHSNNHEKNISKNYNYPRSVGVLVEHFLTYFDRNLFEKFEYDSKENKIKLFFNVQEELLTKFFKKVNNLTQSFNIESVEYQCNLTYGITIKDHFKTFLEKEASDYYGKSAKELELRKLMTVLRWSNVFIVYVYLFLVFITFIFFKQDDISIIYTSLFVLTLTIILIFYRFLNTKKFQHLLKQFFWFYMVSLSIFILISGYYICFIFLILNWYFFGRTYYLTKIYRKKIELRNIL